MSVEVGVGAGAGVAVPQAAIVTNNVSPTSTNAVSRFFDRRSAVIYEPRYVTPLFNGRSFVKYPSAFGARQLHANEFHLQ